MDAMVTSYDLSSVVLIGHSLGCSTIAHWSLVEELQCEGEQFRPTTHPRVFRFVAAGETSLPPEALRAQVTDLLRLEPGDCKQAIRRLVPEYVPFAE